MHSESQAFCHILQIPISTCDLAEALETVRRFVASKQGARIHFANVHTVTESQWNQDLKSAMLESQALNLADGVPLVWVSKLRKYPIKSRVCGPDFMEAFLINKGIPSFNFAQGIVGGLPGQAELIRDRFGLKDTICYAPPFREVTRLGVQEDLGHLALDTKIPDLVWVGLGAPKQEIWMSEAAKIWPNTVFLAVGAAFDFLTGTKSRAPLWMQRSGLEWLYRLVKEPRRLWKRYFVTNSAFIAKVGFEQLKLFFKHG